MDYLVNMVRDSVEAGGRDHFSCSSSAWDLLLELGHTFGWKPLGTSYAPSDTAMAPDNPTRHDYRPSDRQDSKLVVAADALAWAAALNEARSSPHLAIMLEERRLVATSSNTSSADALRSVNTPFVSTMDEFIAYAFGGAFEFFRSP